MSRSMSLGKLSVIFTKKHLRLRETIELSEHHKSLYEAPANDSKNGFHCTRFIQDQLICCRTHHKF
jgi:hypothetical protein